jgi:hypothetical protein
MRDLSDYRATFLSFALPQFQQYGKFHNAAPAEDVPTWDETTDPEEYKKQIDEYGNGYTQADYYTSPAYLAYLKQVQKLSAAKAAEEAARMAYMVNKAMADASAAAAAASEAERQRLIDEAIAKAIKEAEDAAKNYMIMGVKVPKVAVWLIGGGAALFLIWKFVIKK